MLGVHGAEAPEHWVIVAAQAVTLRGRRQHQHDGQNGLSGVFTKKHLQSHWMLLVENGLKRAQSLR